MARKPSVISSIFGAIVAAFLIGPTASVFWRRIDEPYMDEIFHVPQAQRYCSGDFATWDPKITTLPGLYLYATAMQPILNFLYRVRSLGSAPSEADWACAPKVLRAENALLGLMIAAVSARLLSRLHPKASSSQRLMRTAAIVLFPVLYFYFFLFYSDAIGLLMVLLMYERTLAGDAAGAAVLGAAAFVCRQTNAVWVLFCAGEIALRKVQESKEGGGGQGGGEAWLVGEAARAVRLVLSKLFLVVLRGTWPLLAVLCGIAGFVVQNKGIAVGDKENHQASLYVMQAGYLAAFVAASLAPWACTPTLLGAFTAFLRRNVLLAAAALLATLAGVHYCTYAHPFLLADNRHYTFYIWKNVFRRHFLPRYLLSGFYLYSAWAISASLSRTCSRLWVLWFSICCCGVVIPTGLLEFRYFLLPAILALLHWPFERSEFWLLQEGLGLLGYAGLNTLTVLVFVFKPFAWPDGSVARFMW